MYIGQCYLFLRQVENNPGETLLQEWLPGEKEQWLAEAHFLIAYYHFALLRKYGPIPVVTEYVPQSTPSSDFGGRYHYDYCNSWDYDIYQYKIKFTYFFTSSFYYFYILHYH